MPVASIFSTIFSMTGAGITWPTSVVLVLASVFNKLAGIGSPAKTLRMNASRYSRLAYRLSFVITSVVMFSITFPSTVVILFSNGVTVVLSFSAFMFAWALHIASYCASRSSTSFILSSYSFSCPASTKASASASNAVLCSWYSCLVIEYFSSLSH